MMIRQTIIWIAFISLTACAQMRSQVATPLYAQFTRYMHEGKPENIHTLLTKYYTAEFVGAFESLLRQEKQPEQKYSELLLGWYIHEQVNHIEKISAERGCLTVNGYKHFGALGKQAASLNIEYTLVNGEWKISDFEALYGKRAVPFSTQVGCPKDTNIEQSTQ